MNVQQYLTQHSIEDLISEYNIKVKTYEQFIGLNYDQTKSPKNHPITIECRSLKLVKNTWEIASRSFDRFFNYGEISDDTVNVDLDKGYLMEKVDGSIVPIWYNKFDKKWEISSRSSIFGESLLNDTGKTFRESVLDTLKLSEISFQQLFSEIANVDFTYIFEYIGPDNVIVTPYMVSELVLLGVRNNTLQNDYYSLSKMQEFVPKLGKGARMVQLYKLNTMDAVFDSLKQFQNLEEGYVYWNTDNNYRMKIKSEQYLNVFHLKGAIIDEKRIMDLVVSGEYEEVIAYFPQHKDRILNMKSRIIRLTDLMTNTYNQIAHIESQKEYADIASSYPYKHLLFVARKNKTSILDEFNKLSNELKLKLTRASEI